MKEPKERLFSVVIPTELHNRLKTYCTKNGYKIGHVVGVAIMSLLETARKSRTA